MWGKHFIVDAAACNEGVRSADTIRRFADAMVKRINMRAYGPPQVVHFGEAEHVMGYTLVQLIETSNITAHFSDSTGDAYIDVFSCKDFDEADALAVIEEYFSPRQVNTQVLYRQAGGAHMLRDAAA